MPKNSRKAKSKFISRLDVDPAIAGAYGNLHAELQLNKQTNRKWPHPWTDDPIAAPSPAFRGSHGHDQPDDLFAFRHDWHGIHHVWQESIANGPDGSRGGTAGLPLPDSQPPRPTDCVFPPYRCAVLYPSILKIPVLRKCVKMPSDVRH